MKLIAMLKNEPERKVVLIQLDKPVECNGGTSTLLVVEETRVKGVPKIKGHFAILSYLSPDPFLDKTRCDIGDVLQILEGC